MFCRGGLGGEDVVRNAAWRREVREVRIRGGGFGGREEGGVGKCKRGVGGGDCLG